MQKNIFFIVFLILFVNLIWVKLKKCGFWLFQAACSTTLKANSGQVKHYISCLDKANGLCQTLALCYKLFDGIISLPASREAKGLDKGIQ